MPFTGTQNIVQSLELSLKDKHTYSIENERLIRNGTHVAVMYAPGYGAGWSTFNSDSKIRCLFDPLIACAVLLNKIEEIPEDYFSEENGYKDFYGTALQQVTIEWLPKNTLFRVNEYDGFESIELLQDSNWVKA